MVELLDIEPLTCEFTQDIPVIFEDGSPCYHIQLSDMDYLEINQGEGVYFNTVFDENYKPPEGFEVIQTMPCCEPIFSTDCVRNMLVFLKKM